MLSVLGKLPQYCTLLAWRQFSVIFLHIAEIKDKNGLLKQGNADSLTRTQTCR